MEERDRWKADREKERNNREDRDSVFSCHRSRSLTGLAILKFSLLCSSPSLTLLMGDSRVSLFGANYRLFGVGVALRLKAVESPAPTAPNLPIKHSHPQFDHLGKLHCFLITPVLVVIAGGSKSERATFCLVREA